MERWNLDRCRRNWWPILLYEVAAGFLVAFVACALIFLGQVLG